MEVGKEEASSVVAEIKEEVIVPEPSEPVVPASEVKVEDTVVNTADINDLALSDRRRKQDLMGSVLQESDTESTTISANESCTSDVVAL